MAGSDPVNIAVISRAPAPYRLHLLRRIVRELPQVRLHSIFTHHVDRAGVAPWQFDQDESIRPVYFDAHALRNRWKTWVAFFPLYRRICAYLCEHEVRLVVLRGYNDPVRMLLVRWARSRAIPLLVVADSNVFAEGRISGWHRLIKRFYLRWLIRSVAGLMPMGTCGRAYMRVYADHDKPTFLFPYEPDYAALGDLDPTRVAEFATEHGLENGRRRLLYCGRLIPVKCVDVLIDAFLQVAGERPRWDLVLAGDGPMRRALEARIPGHLRGRVKFLGFMQFEAMTSCYNNCDILVLPSVYEPWGLVINEAVASGLAVIATEVVGAAVDLVRHNVNGLIVPPQNVGALASAILEATEGARCERLRAGSAASLKDWRAAADPIQGLAAAIRYFGLMPDSSDSGGTVR